MITERVGDLLEQPDLTHVAHQANLYHSFGAGLAAQIKKKFPYAFKADEETAGDPNKLGTFSMGIAPRHLGVFGPNVVNLYSQRGPEEGFTECLTDYAALREALLRLEAFLSPEARLGLPFRLGCGLAGGSWPKVYGVIEDVFGRSPVEVVVCRRAEDL